MERGAVGIAAPVQLARPPRAAPPLPVADRPPAGRYGEQDRANWIAILTIVIGHVLLLAALVKMDVIGLGPKPAPPTVVELLSIAPPPPPSADPKPEMAPVKPVQPLIVSPPPIVQTPAPPPIVAVAAAPPPPQAVIVSAAPASPAPSAPVSVDLSTKMVSASPPRYPTESRRKHEEGTVVLRLLLGLDGRVDDVSVSRSSGFERLDKAALDAVRRWRWSPTVQAGQPVQVRGFVEIPFVMQG